MHTCHECPQILDARTVVHFYFFQELLYKYQEVQLQKISTEKDGPPVCFRHYSSMVFLLWVGESFLQSLL